MSLSTWLSKSSSASSSAIIFMTDLSSPLLSQLASFSSSKIPSPSSSIPSSYSYQWEKFFARTGLYVYIHKYSMLLSPHQPHSVQFPCCSFGNKNVTCMWLNEDLTQVGLITRLVDNRLWLHYDESKYLCLGLMKLLILIQIYIYIYHSCIHTVAIYLTITYS